MNKASASWGDEMDCEGFDAVAAELALGVLMGRERAAALEHLDRCDACREHVRQLTMTGEELLGLLPSIEPPAGFETRVLDRIGITDPVLEGGGRRGRWRRPSRADGITFSRRTLAAAAVVVAVLVAAVGGWGMRAATSQQAVGKVFLYSGSPHWVYMSVYLESNSGPVTCELVGKDGRVTTVGTFRMNDGYGAWGSPDPVDNGQIVGARLVSADGKVLASAQF